MNVLKTRWQCPDFLLGPTVCLFCTVIINVIMIWKLLVVFLLSSPSMCFQALGFRMILGSAPDVRLTNQSPSFVTQDVFNDYFLSDIKSVCYAELADLEKLFQISTRGAQKCQYSHRWFTSHRLIIFEHTSQFWSWRFTAGLFTCQFQWSQRWKMKVLCHFHWQVICFSEFVIHYKH